MLKKITSILFLALLFLSACSPAGGTGEEEPQGRKNPRNARAAVKDGIVTITIPGRTAFFWLEKVNDDSVPYDRLYFKYDPAERRFLFQTNLDDWKSVPLEDHIAEIGKVRITFGEKEIIITYPSGTWAFP